MGIIKGVNKVKKLLILCVLVSANIGVSSAEQLTIPNTFTSGTTAKSLEVNENFTAVENAINNLDGANLKPSSIQRGALARESVTPENKGRSNTIRAAFGNGTSGDLYTVPAGKIFIVTDFIATSDIFRATAGKYWVDISSTNNGNVLRINLPVSIFAYGGAGQYLWFLRSNEIHFEAGIPFAEGEVISYSGVEGQTLGTLNVQVTISGYEIVSTP